MEPDLSHHPLAARGEARTGLYVHVPFCARRCTYCDFSTGALSAGAVERYLAAMEREVERRAPAASSLTFSSVFFGGGTPSALASRHFRRLGALVRGHFRIEPDAEITLEANPESVKSSLLEAWAEAGVNRLSMGAQSFDARELVELGRIHSAERPGEAMALARSAGIRRLSLDLMFGFPGNDLPRWRATVERALALEPGHLSAYCFIPEPGTPLGDAVENGAAQLPEPEEQADAYGFLTERLERAGYDCYETSNFCRSGQEARHNLVYWLRRPYLALGPSAHGFTNGVRYGNHYALPRWAAALENGEAPEAETEHETEASGAQEVMMLGLRLADGIREMDYPRPLWRAVRRRYAGAFERALGSGRLERQEDFLRIPARLRFVADDVIAWIEAVGERLSFDSHSVPSIPLRSCHSLHSPAA